MRIRVELTDRLRRHKAELAVLAVSSKDSIRSGLRAVDASPFKTVFVVDEETGRVLFFLSRNEEYVEKARKKKPPEEPPPPPPSNCCQLCYAKGGYACDDLGDGSCICYGATRETGQITGDDSLETLAD